MHDSPIHYQRVASQNPGSTHCIPHHLLGCVCIFCICIFSCSIRWWRSLLRFLTRGNVRYSKSWGEERWSKHRDETPNLTLNWSTDCVRLDSFFLYRDCSTISMHLDKVPYSITINILIIIIIIIITININIITSIPITPFYYCSKKQNTRKEETNVIQLQLFSTRLDNFPTLLLLLFKGRRRNKQPYRQKQQQQQQLLSSTGSLLFFWNDSILTYHEWQCCWWRRWWWHSTS